MRHALGIGLLVAGCQGLVVVLPPEETTSSSTAGGAAGTGASHPDCATANAVRLCGGSKACAWLGPPTCPGTGCTAALDVNAFTPSGAGVCWADVDDAAARQCVACRDGDVCVQRYDDQLVCVAEEVCAGLWDLGATTVCRYADKVRYDRRPLPSATGCPSTGQIHFCGGGCPPCPGTMGCTGRSPDHPFGLCVPMTAQGEFQGVACSNTAAECHPGQFNDTACGVFSVPTVDDSAARRYGVCLDRKGCLIIRDALPGGFRCLDKFGDAL